MPARRARLALLLAWVAPLSVACAHALDAPSPDALETQIDAGTTAGSTSSAGSDADGGSSSAGLGYAGGAPSLPQAGADSSGQAGSVGESGAGAAGRAAGGGNSGGAAGGSSAGAGSAGAAGVLAAAGAGSHVCKVTADFDAYTPSKAGCGGYTTCKGQIHWRNDEAHALSQMVLSFPEPAGVICTSDNATSKWAITDNGASSQRCVFTANAGALSVDSRSALSFGYDTTQADTTTPTELSVSDPSCD